MLNFFGFLIKKVCASLGKLTTLIGTRIKAKKHRTLEFNHSHLLKPCIELNSQKRIEAEKNGHKDRKTLY